VSEFRGIERKPGVRETRFERELRQLSLTQRLLGYNARTQTICALAGLTPHKVSVLRRGCEQSATARHRGPSPNSFSLLLRSPRARAESACLAVLLDRFGALPKRYGGGTSRWTLHSAERLCDVFDFYGRLVPRSAISFEQLVLLSKGLCDPTCLRSEACQQCGATIVVDPVARPRLRCDACISYGIDAPRVPAAPADGQRPVIQPAPTAETI
jgi:hypothetical protein